MREKSASVLLFRFCLVLLGGFFLANILGGLFAMVFFGLSQEDVHTLLNEPDQLDNATTGLLLMQGVVSFVIFVLSPLFYIYKLEKEPFALPWRIQYKADELIRLGILIFFITWFVMPLNSVIIEWNRNIDFPAFLETFERWAQQREALAEQLTGVMTHFSSWKEFLLGILIIGVIPAVGEELVFRYILQRKLKQLTGNIHVAIIIAGFVFSLFHLQFYGLIPRMLLGVLFGYVFYWSGTIWAPIFAHFVNNAGTVVLMYLHQQEVMSYDIEQPESAKPLPVMVFTLLTLVLLMVFRKLTAEKHRTDRSFDNFF